MAATTSSTLLRLYRSPGLHPAQLAYARQTIASALQLDLTEETVGGAEHSLLDLRSEHCYYVSLSAPLAERQLATLEWLIAETFEPDSTATTSFLDSLHHPSADAASDQITVGELIEFGPRTNFCTPFSSNAVAICAACDLNQVTRVERSRRLWWKCQLAEGRISPQLSDERRALLVDSLHDRMTECVYLAPPATFENTALPEPWVTVPVMAEGMDALKKVNAEMGLSFDEADLARYCELFQKKIGRDPTIVELFDISQSNSEHCRHWFFGGQLVIDGVPKEKTLFQLVKDTLAHEKGGNSVVAFSDNSSSIRGHGHPLQYFAPEQPGQASPMQPTPVELDITFTAETHNFPTGIAPFPGAATGTGGRIRDGHATGRGSHVLAGTAGYSVGQLLIPGYELPWEDASLKYSKFASPLKVIVEASNGASDYGNKFGEPLINGFTRSFCTVLPNGERREYMKPIMFSGGIGDMSAEHRRKDAAAPGMLVVKLGGPAYRIGVGGGAASSLVQREDREELDFKAVQRGDPEMEQKVNRVIRACVELGAKNPILSIHDQGAGGNGNVLKELVDPSGALIDVRKIIVGDSTLSVLEIWGAEYQEADGLLIGADSLAVFSKLCDRENAPFAVVGTVTSDGVATLIDSKDDSVPLQLDLKTFLGELPQKTFESTTLQPESSALELPVSESRQAALENCMDRVLRHLSVASKRFLTNKVDRSVTGRIAQQQCVGPLQLPLANCGVIASSFFGNEGAVTAIGEQPIKGLLCPKAMAELTVGEMLTNICWVQLTSLDHIKCSGNWMWAAKLEHEGAAMYEACQALRDVMIVLGVSIDGGKDSLSMAAQCGDEMIKTPGTLVVSGYCTTDDVMSKVTPDIKLPGETTLLLVDLGQGQARVGGSVLAQTFAQLGQCSPRMDDPALFRKAIEVQQQLLKEGKILAGHDRSDGGLLVTLLEMAFSGDCGLKISIPSTTTEYADAHLQQCLAPLFAEELGFVLEVRNAELEATIARFAQVGVTAVSVASTTVECVVQIYGDQIELSRDMRELRDVWEATGFELERRQANPICVHEEQSSLKHRRTPNYKLSFAPTLSPRKLLSSPPRVAVIREEGSNGDREMGATFYQAGFEVWDVTMSDLRSSRCTLESFRGVAFVGGFSFGDVLDSAKGWTATIEFHSSVRDQFTAFAARKDTFSLGVCNGCQLMSLLGWVPFPTDDFKERCRFVHNVSDRFESRFSTVRIEESPSIMLQDMIGSVLGVWVAHGEGRAKFPQESTLARVEERKLIPVRYVDDVGEPTEAYPFNPPGSPNAIAALCSEDGRHLAMMPHPERAFLKFQWPWMPQQWKDTLECSPWMQMFYSAFEWCQSHSH